MRSTLVVSNIIKSESYQRDPAKLFRISKLSLVHIKVGMEADLLIPVNNEQFSEIGFNINQRKHISRNDKITYHNFGQIKTRRLQIFI